MSDSTAPKKNFWKLSRRERWVALLSLTTLLIGVWLPERIVVITSPSLDHRVFFKVPVPAGNIRNGDYLGFRYDGKDVTFVYRGSGEETDLVVKRVGCEPGQVLSHDSARGFICEGKVFGTALAKDSKGHTLPQFHYDGLVPEDSYFMVGTNPRSYDSRYFGFLHGKDFVFKALPLW